MDDERFVLGVAYQAGPDPRIKRGADGGRDYFTEAELAKAAHTFLGDGARQIGVGHADGTVGVAKVVQSYIWPAEYPFVHDGVIVAKKGDWLIGAIFDEPTWALVKSGQLTGWSPQGQARRIARSN